MILSEVSICNQALGWLGANLITDFDDGSDEANLCKANYDYIRDAVLEDTGWSFALKRDQIPLLADAELGYGSAFQLPDDCIRVERIFSDSRMYDGDQLEYVIEDRKVLTDNGTCFIRYIARIIDVSRFSPNFVQALAYRIATDLAIPLTKSRTMQLQMFELYNNRLEVASATDGMQGRSRRIRVSRMNNYR